MVINIHLFLFSLWIATKIKSILFSLNLRTGSINFCFRLLLVVEHSFSNFGVYYGEYWWFPVALSCICQIPWIFSNDENIMICVRIDRTPHYWWLFLYRTQQFAYLLNKLYTTNLLTFIKRWFSYRNY